MEAAIRRLDVDIVHDTGVGWTYDVLHPQAGSKIANSRRDLDSRTASERWRRRLQPSQWLRRRELRELERRQFVKSRGAVAAPSKMVETDLRRLYDVGADRCRVIPNAVDTERFSPRRLLPLRDAARRKFGFGAQTVFLFAARNPVLKGLRPLLEAMRRLPACRLLVIGAASRDIPTASDNVTFAGYVEDALTAYAAADAVIQPSYYDACSLTVLEAWACGLPAVTTRWNGASELMENGKEGFGLEDPDDVSAMAEAMQRLRDPDVRREISGHARALAERHTFEHHLDRLEAVYRSVA